MNVRIYSLPRNPTKIYQMNIFVKKYQNILEYSLHTATYQTIRNSFHEIVFFFLDSCNISPAFSSKSMLDRIRLVFTEY